MKSMIYFEFAKIFRRKVNVIVMLAGIVLMVVCAVNYVRQEPFYDKASGTYVNGREAFRLEEKANNEMTDYLTEEYLTGVVEGIQEKYIDMDMESDKAYEQVIQTKEDLISLICKNYADVGEEMDWNKLNEISTEDGIGFYERRLDKVEERLNMDFSYGNYSEAEKEFWMEKEKEVQTPFAWGDKTVMNKIWTMMEVGFYFLFVIAVCTAPVFASEYESGASALLLTTRYGKTKLIYAKILASVLFALVYTAVGLGIGVGILGLAVGFHGAELPVQLWDSIIPYDWSIGKTLWISFAIILLIGLMISLLTLLLSARVKSGLSTLVIMFALLVGPTFLPMSKTSGLWNHINYLFPVRVTMTKEAISTLNSYQFGPVILSYLGMAVLTYVVVSVISFFGIGNGFARHQVSK
ncbi:MAG: ABC transporter permease subunit [Lachnospiraceae bacterium]|nr:ABC transporter permease subunit [Lachnospiraceae bacterium]